MNINNYDPILGPEIFQIELDPDDFEKEPETLEPLVIFGCFYHSPRCDEPGGYDIDYTIHNPRSSQRIKDLEEQIKANDYYDSMIVGEIISRVN